MNTVRYVQWQEEGTWLGFREEFPDYWTQGDSLEELEENLRIFMRISPAVTLERFADATGSRLLISFAPRSARKSA